MCVVCVVCSVCVYAEAYCVWFGGGIMDVFESELIKIKRRLRLPCEIATPRLFTYLYGYGLRPKRGSCAIC